MFFLKKKTKKIEKFAIPLKKKKKNLFYLVNILINTKNANENKIDCFEENKFTSL